MKVSLARGLVILATVAAVVVGCRSLYNSAGDGADPTGSPAAGPDAFSGAQGFFTAGSHDVRPGTPGIVEEESEEGEDTASHFRAIQIDPLYETSAGPKFVLPFDIDNDGLVDLLTGWTQNQPVQIHLQRRDADDKLYFISVNLGGTSPIGVLGDVDMIDFDGDGWLDVAVLVKETGSVGACPSEGWFRALDDAGTGEVEILFNPGNPDQITDGDAWREVRLERSQLPGRRDVPVEKSVTYPEYNSYTGLAVGEIDGINGPDIVVAYNPAKCDFYGDDPNPVNRIVLYANPGGGNMFEGGAYPLTVTAKANGPGEVNTNGANILLDGTESYYRIGVPGLGPAFAEVSCSWTQVAGPAVTIAGANSCEATVKAPATPTALGFRLEVSTGNARDFDHVSVVVVEPGGVPTNQPPLVVVDEEEYTVLPDIDHSGSVRVEMSAAGSDPDGDTLTYTWTQVNGTSVTLSDANSPSTSFAVPAGSSELRFRVTVSDGTLPASDVVVVNSGFWAPVVLEGNLPRVCDVKMTDVDLDEDNDVIFTYPDALSRNIAWGRNPADHVDPAVVLDAAFWEMRPIGHVDSWAETFALGDVDMDGYEDVVVRSSEGMVVQWFRHPTGDDRDPVFPPPDVVPDRFNFPWQVYTMAEYLVGRPAALGVGDLTGDGLNEVVTSAGGVVYWYDGSLVTSRYEKWVENFVVDDTKANGTTDDPNNPNFQDKGTVIFNLTIVDLDGDGYADVVAPFDRRVNSGLAEDTLIWFRNILGESE